MKKITIGFSRSKSNFKLGSKLIQEVEKRDFSHVYIKYTDQMTEREIIAQASKGFVHEMNYNIFCENNVVVEEYQIYCSDSNYNKIMCFIKDNLGTPYSNFQLFMISIKKLFKVELPVRDSRKEYICSELAAFICKLASLEIPGDLNYITPSDLNKFIKDLPSTLCKRLI